MLIQSVQADLSFNKSLMQRRKTVITHTKQQNSRFCSRSLSKELNSDIIRNMKICYKMLKNISNKQLL